MIHIIYPPGALFAHALQLKLTHSGTLISNKQL